MIRYGVCVGLVLLAACSSASGHTMASGTYAVTNLTAMDDGCRLALDGSTGGYHLVTTAVTTDGHSLALGDVNSKFTPPVHAQGQGSFSDDTHATTTMSSTFAAPDGTCSYTLSVSTREMVVGNNAMTVELTQSESSRTAGCVPAVGAACTSTWTFSIHM